MSFSSKFGNVFNIYVQNIGKLIIPPLALLIAEIVLGALVFLAVFASVPLMFYNIFALGVTAIVATLVISLIIAFVFAGVVIALIEISKAVLEGETKEPLDALTEAYRKPYYPQAAIASIVVAVLIWLLGSAHSLLGFLAAGALYPLLIATVTYLMEGFSLNNAASKAIDKLLNVLNADAAALAIVFIIGLVSKIAILDVFALPLLTLYLTYILGKGM